MRFARSVLPALLVAAISPAAASLPSDLDLVFVLDATGSMSGEIREVKERVRQIADVLGAERPGAEVRLGVVAYRDRKDEFVTRVSPLSGDVDTSFGFLSTLEAQGGGDAPEDVLSGLAAALGELDWDPAASTERQLFLIGDAPPHLDYDDGARPDELIREAVERRIVLNAIGCRSLSSRGVEFFRELAYSTEGSYHHIGGVSLGKTPGPPGSGGVTGALLETLGSEPSEDEGEPIGIFAFDRPPIEAVRTIEVELIGLPEAGCGLRLRLPEGLRLEDDPRARLRDDGLHVSLTVGEGQGDHVVFDLERCIPDGAAVHVEVD